MRAAIHHRYGPPEVVRIAEVDAPTAGPADVLVKVHATTVNRTDCAYRAARPVVLRAFTGLRRPRRTVLGTEFAGVVEAVGPQVTSFSVGQPVFGYNEGAHGAHAEYLAVPQDGRIAAVPEGVPLGEAAAGTEGAHYAYAMIRRARVRPGQDVLVHGATGAIGSAAVQLLKVRGATVTAVCDTAGLDTVRRLGADRAVDRTVDDFTQDRQRYDAVLDAVGKSTFGRCRRLLRRDGCYVSAEPGPFAQNLALAVVTPVLPGRSVLFPFPSIDQRMVRFFAELMESGRFRPLIDRHYAMERIVEAYRYVETGRKVGSVIIEVGPAWPVAGPTARASSG